MNSPPLVAVDWGSTNLRVKLVVDGRVAAQRETPDGIRSRGDRSFESILAAACGSWREEFPGIRVLMSGMIGSREGWCEAPYAAAPAGAEELSARLVPLASEAFGPMVVVPGLRWDDPTTGLTDVMRGEETQLVGLMAALPSAGAAVCLPGTHSKWAVCRHGRIERFRTWMTGEVFEVLSRGTLISGSGGSADASSPAFRRGLEISGVAGGLSHQLFLARTEMLAGRAASAELPSLVSGILIGHELREARVFAGDLPVVLFGDSPAAAAAAAALHGLGTPFQRIREDRHVPGILALAGANPPPLR